MSGDYPRAVFRNSSSIATSGEIPSALGAFVFFVRGFGVVIARASSESASNHFSRVALGAFGVVVLGAGVLSFAISDAITRNEPSAAIIALSCSSAVLSDSARSELLAILRRALGEPSLPRADSRRFVSDLAISLERGNISTTAPISFLFIF